MDMPKFITGTTHDVDVTFINNPGSFYIRPASLRDEVEQMEKKGTPMSYKDLEIRKRVIYFSPKIKKFVRGEIESITYSEVRTMYTIHAIDYGCYDRDVCLINITAPGSLAVRDCPPTAVHCQLHLCSPLAEQFDDDAITTMKMYVGHHTANMTVRGNTQDKLTIELRTVEVPEDVSTMLAYAGCSTLFGELGASKASKTVCRFYEPELELFCYKQKEVNVGDRFLVRVQSGDSMKDFYVAEVHEFKKYREEAPTFSEYCRLQSVADVQMALDTKRSCGIRVGQPPRYERGYVKAIIEPNKCLAKLIDLGTEVQTYFENVKTVSAPFYLDIPAVAIHCSTDDKPWHNGLPKFLYPGYHFIIEIVKLGNEELPHSVKIYQTKI